MNLMEISMRNPKSIIIIFALFPATKKVIRWLKSILVCTKCGLCEYYPVYVTSYNHSMKPLRKKCIHKRLDNFKAILNQFFNG